MNLFNDCTQSTGLKCHVPLAGEAATAVIYPAYSDAIFLNVNNSFVLNCSGNGSAVTWSINGTDATTQAIKQRGIHVIPFLPTSPGAVLSQLSIQTTAENNNTEVMCLVIEFKNCIFSVKNSSIYKFILQGVLIFIT